ncbi:hypothetical protein PT974_04974 [Cladobotryum mycophilum]|uniref:Tat pathway signal sequence n=1 Tax=Cladobotryum mycophilum TaxID=491253 RepID=A0ABR0SQP8_9HYPO
MSPFKQKANMGAPSPTKSDLSYAQLLGDEVDSVEDVRHFVRVPVWSGFQKTLVVLNVVLFVTSLCCLGLSFLVYRKSSTIGEREILKRSTFYSPPIDAFTPKWRVEDVTTHPIATNESVFRRDPSPDVDEAWSRVSDLGVIPLTREQVVGLGKNPSTVLKAPKDWGVGDDAYLGQFDGVHLIHCLNAMRKSLYYNYHYYYPNGHPAAYSIHLSHCQEALAKWLMCQPSLELITFNWVEEHELPFPDFDIKRKCWSFDRLKEWQDKHRIEAVNTEQWQKLKLPNGVTRDPAPQLLKEELDVIGKVNKTSSENVHQGVGMTIEHGLIT